MVRLEGENIERLFREVVVLVLVCKNGRGTMRGHGRLAAFSVRLCVFVQTKVEKNPKLQRGKRLKNWFFLAEKCGAAWATREKVVLLQRRNEIAAQNSNL